MKRFSRKQNHPEYTTRSDKRLSLHDSLYKTRFASKAGFVIFALGKKMGFFLEEKKSEKLTNLK
jgi:hypothetical protein